MIAPIVPRPERGYQMPPEWWTERQLCLAAGSERISYHTRVHRSYILGTLVEDLASKDVGQSPRALTSEERSLRDIREFIKKADTSLVLGWSPISRAVIYMAVAESSGENPSGELADQVNEAFARGMGTEEQEAATKFQELSQPRMNIGESPGKGHDLDEHEIKNAKVAISRLPGGAADALDKIGRTLDTARETSVVPEISFREDPMEAERETRKIKGPHEYAKLVPGAMAGMVLNPHLSAYSIASEEADVRVRGEKKTRKQLAVLVIDVSGSMVGGPLNMAGAIIVNRLQAVARGDCELVVTQFASRVADKELVVKEVDDLRDVADLVTEYLRQGFRSLGGGTNVLHALHRAAFLVEKLMSDEHTRAPDITLVTDAIADKYGLAEPLLKMRNLGSRLNMIMIANAGEKMDIHEAEAIQAFIEGRDCAGIIREAAQASGGDTHLLDYSTGELLSPLEISELPERLKKYQSSQWTGRLAPSLLDRVYNPYRQWTPERGGKLWTS